MPGIPHVDEQTMSSLFRYMGGIPRSFNFPGRRGDNKKATGPIVDSGGARIKPDVIKGTSDVRLSGRSKSS
jgi:quinoprotein glucose dehydrogenase